MKKTVSLVVILFSTIILWGQNKPGVKPLIIQGQITNCPEKYLRILFHDKNGQWLMDTLHLDESGKFYLKTYKLPGPQRASIQQNNIQINDIFVAPGYNLTIKGNGKDFSSLFKSKTISGIGSESNRYRLLLDSAYLARKDTTLWFELKRDELLSYISNQQKLKDSIYHITFDKKPIHDEYLKYFGSMVRLDNIFSKLNMLVTHVNINNYSYDSSVSFIRDNFDHKILENIYNEQYLISNDYNQGLIAKEWPNYLVNLDLKKDSTLLNQKDYNLKKIATTYQGKVKEYVLHIRMASDIESCRSFAKLNEYKERFAPYISNLKSNFYKTSLEKKFIEKENELIRTQVGKPAPLFTLENNFGETFTLEEFKGKVIYLDLWASWCGPCRAETPSFKILYDKFKDNSQIAFISIAVHDGVNEWKKAIEKDKPNWLQLIDKDGFVWKSYVANAIPKFILIDKKGNIVDFDAPRPSNALEIEKLLNKEIEK
ncbi:TlpA family protein disulfide reductase [Parafilimonas sp.]|uniref:TlpA family protein disulfide reductase n=1 Tax=Parafilimonas sp. TaxID=1969739 RepID=UPI0039E46E48